VSRHEHDINAAIIGSTQRQISPTYSCEVRFLGQAIQLQSFRRETWRELLQYGIIRECELIG